MPDHIHIFVQADYNTAPVEIANVRLGELERSVHTSRHGGEEGYTKGSSKNWLCGYAIY